MGSVVYIWNLLINKTNLKAINVSYKFKSGFAISLFTINLLIAILDDL